MSERELEVVSRRPADSATLGYSTARTTLRATHDGGSKSRMLSVLKGTGPGSAAQAARYSLHGGMFQELSPSLQIEMAERTRKGPIGDWTRISEGVDCTPQQRHTSNQQLASRAAAQ